MTTNGRVAELSPSDRIRQKLDDPRVAASVDDLLEHADLLAVLVSGLDGLVRRGDTVSDSFASAIGEFTGDGRGAALSQSIPGLQALRTVDLAGLATSFATLSETVVGATPALNSLLESRLTDPLATEVLAQLGEALVEAKTVTASNSSAPRGVFGMLKAARDPDVARGLGFLIQVARSFGRQLR
jgi:Protein of unknown function (DUF1641)